MTVTFLTWRLHPTAFVEPRREQPKRAGLNAVNGSDVDVMKPCGALCN
jgi:hypothetical protein